MSRLTETRLKHPGHDRAIGSLMRVSSDGSIRYYGGNSPRTIIDLPGFKGHLTVYSFSNFEFGKQGDLDALKLIRGHQEGELLFAFQDVKGNGSYRYELISPEGSIGFLTTSDRTSVIPFIASLFIDHPEHIELAEDTRIDEGVIEYLRSKVGLPIHREVNEDSSRVA